MRRTHAAVGSAMFFLLAPGTVAGLVPWLLTGWHSDAPPVLRVAGVVVIVLGLVPLVAAFTEFTRAGGTPSPTAPTQRLVVSGFNRYVRNPMYLGVLLTILGQALLFGDPGLIGYGVAFWLVTAVFVRFYEEPTLSDRYGTEYDTYRRAVRAWLPHLHAWPDSGGGEADAPHDRGGAAPQAAP
jgi:protein-S-isoprenylcysteine O-methyltransferase Ste14